MELIPELLRRGIIQRGEFTLKSGRKSNLYADFRKVIGYPRLLKELSYELGKEITSHEGCVIVGVPLGGLPYATIVSSIFNLPMIMMRDKKKDYGLQNTIEGETFNTFATECVVIEDVVTTGGSVLNSVKLLESEGLIISEIVVILDREQGGVQMLESQGYKVKSLYQLNQLINTGLKKNVPATKPPIRERLDNIVLTKETNLIFSADLVNPRELLEIVDKVGSEICGVKIHTDLIDFSEVPYSYFCKAINHLKSKHNLIAIEDRKYSDIGSIVEKQFNIINSWADMVTAYGITGMDSIRVLDEKGVGILLIHSLSTKGNLVDTIYSCRVKDMAKDFKNVVGFISQKRVLNGYLNFSPGVNIGASGDNKGQNYNSPEYMLDQGTDIFIVGRGIYEKKNPELLAKNYRKRCWKIKS